MAKSGSGLSKQYLYLDGVTSRDLRLALVTRENIVKHKVVAEGTRTEKLLPAIAAFVPKGGVSGIIVAQGGGSFSQARIVCTVANALAYGWGIKVVGVKSTLTLEQVGKKLPKFKWQRLVLPKYSGPGVR